MAVRFIGFERFTVPCWHTSVVTPHETRYVRESMRGTGLDTRTEKANWPPLARGMANH